MASSALETCVFCSIVSGKIATPFVYEDDAVVAFADIRPIAPTHILVVPREHHETLAELVKTGTAGDLLGRLMKVAGELGAARAPKDGGYRVVVNNGAAAGQTVYHVHVHVLSGRHFAWPPG
ncbi:MAG TPA: HIT domain-containing protein [Candidatus Tumulicola sp.]|nr:HIT domain-containing protein [Candidatus Tumulicola sp.]